MHAPGWILTVGQARAAPAEAVDLGYHLFPTYLSKPPSVVSSPTGAGGLFGRISRVLSDYDRADQGLVARPAVVFPVMQCVPVGCAIGI
jgi:hypothetical protein